MNSIEMLVSEIERDVLRQRFRSLAFGILLGVIFSTIGVVVLAIRL